MFKKIAVVLLTLATLFTAYLYVKSLNAQGMDSQSVSSFPDGDFNVAKSIKGSKAGVVSTLSFGSCNRQDKPQAYWSTILNHQPDAWIWLGDNIYGDSPDMDVLAAKYAKQKNDPYYQQLLATTAIYGIWDDHDYGTNDGGKNWPHKAAAEQLMLDFLDVPKDAPVRNYPGTYQSYTIGEEAGRQIKLILLDTRYFQDELTSTPKGNPQRYYINETGDILGEAQWQWLTTELQDSTAAVTLIASSIQVLPEEQGYEKWANFPAARQRLLDLVAASPANNPVFLSGDRHIGEISKWLLPNELCYFEVTSSGLTHSYNNVAEPNKYRVGEVTGERNYGLLRINWANQLPDLLFELRSVEDDRVFSRLILGPAADLPLTEALSLFTPNKTMPTALKPCPESPNCVSSQSSQPKKKRDPLTYTGDGKTALRALRDVVSGMSRTKLVAEQANYLHFEFTTWPIPFVDDVEFLLDEAAGVIHFRSASRVGYSDLGANGKRMKKVAKAWEARKK